MATYSKVTSTGNYTIYLVVNNVDQDVANNQSKVQYKAYITGASGTSSWGTGNWSLNINGTTSSGSISYDFSSSKTWYCVGSASAYVTSGYIAHNSDGTKSITVAFSFSGSSLVGSASISQTFTLDTIPRASDVTVSAYTITNTTGSMSATITSKANFYHKWRWKLASGSWSSWTNKGLISTTSSTVTVANTSLLSNLPTSTSGSFTIEVATYSDSGYATHVGTKSATATVTVNTSNIKPTVSLANISLNSTPISGYAVAGYSKAQTTCTTTNSSGASSFTNYFSVSHGTLQTTSSTTASTSVVTNVLPSNTSNYTLTISAYARDSRGATSSTVSKTITVYGYQAPTATLNAYRTETDSSTAEDGAGTHVYVTFSGAVRSSINNQNSVQSTACTYSGSISGTATSGRHYRLADTQSVTFTLTVTDKVSSTTATVTVAPAKYPLDLYDNGSGTVGVAFGTTAVANAVTSAMQYVVKASGANARFVSTDTRHNGDIRVGWGGNHTAHGVWSQGYSTDGETMTTDNIWMIYRNSNGKVIVNGVTIPDDLYYQTGDTITLTTGVLTGWITGSAKTLQLFTPLAKRLDNISSVTITKFIMTARGISGYVEGSTQFDYTQNTDYTVSATVDVNTNGILFRIDKASAAFTGGTNNTVVTALIRNIVLELS